MPRRAQSRVRTATWALAERLRVDVGGEVAAQRQAVGAHDPPKGVPVAPGNCIQDSRKVEGFEHVSANLRGNSASFLDSPVPNTSHTLVGSFLAKGAEVKLFV